MFWQLWIGTGDGEGDGDGYSCGPTASRTTGRTPARGLTPCVGSARYGLLRRTVGGRTSKSCVVDLQAVQQAPVLGRVERHDYERNVQRTGGLQWCPAPSNSRRCPQPVSRSRPLHRRHQRLGRRDRHRYGADVRHRVQCWVLGRRQFQRCCQILTRLSKPPCTERDFTHRFASPTVEIGGWETGAVTSMADMFRRAGLFNSDLSGWDVDSVASYSSFDWTASSWCDAHKPLGFTPGSSYC